MRIIYFEKIMLFEIYVNILFGEFIVKYMYKYIVLG